MPGWPDELPPRRAAHHGRQQYPACAGAVAYVALHDDRCRNIGGAPEGLDGLRDPRRVIGIANTPHIPAISEEARRDVFAEGEIGAAFNCYVITVVNPAEVPESQVTDERGGFTLDALHHVTVTAQRVNVVVENREAGPIEALRG
jgi:hypothetical protein